jgi:phage-related protein
MKRVEFLGDALVELRKFPEAARKEAGVQLHKVQMGLDPSDWKPMATVGAGVREIRIRDEAGAFRVLYVANVGDAVYVPHAFQKKTQQNGQAPSRPGHVAPEANLRKRRWSVRASKMFGMRWKNPRERPRI